MSENNELNGQKLLSEEYRVCSQRADELSRLVWQFFLALVAFSGAGLAIIAKIPDGMHETGTLLVTCVCIMTIFIINHWRKVAAKWRWQQQLLYMRLDELEHKLEFKTNAQFNTKDNRTFTKKNIARSRHWITQAISYAWCIILVIIGCSGIAPYFNRPTYLQANCNCCFEYIPASTFLTSLTAMFTGLMLFFFVLHWEFDEISKHSGE